MFETDLTIDQVGMPTFSARQCQQTLVPLHTGDFRRTLEGKLIYLGRQSHEKYRSIIECQDKAAPALENIWRGSVVRVGCLSYLTQEGTLLGSITLKREPVKNSVSARSSQQQIVEIESVVDRQVTLKNTPVLLERGEAETQQLSQGKIFISYRPMLMMRVIHYHCLVDEWGFKNRWRIDLEEV